MNHLTKITCALLLTAVAACQETDKNQDVQAAFDLYQVCFHENIKSNVLMLAEPRQAEILFDITNAVCGDLTAMRYRAIYGTEIRSFTPIKAAEYARLRFEHMRRWVEKYQSTVAAVEAAK